MPAVTRWSNRRRSQGSAREVRGRAHELAEQGVTEIVYQPCGPDIRRELDRFIDAVRP